MVQHENAVWNVIEGQNQHQIQTFIARSRSELKNTIVRNGQSLPEMRRLYFLLGEKNEEFTLIAVIMEIIIEQASVIQWNERLMDVSMNYQCISK
ncbi:hypothetical protein AVEN_52093-1 [Araneus ventricosus]|uniref:Uncharacterized protein n=1 Tax=Araneus ventricosus TaxID=182803 RepID=A0A4Y2VDJ1_ARAVE|nr:hypothetical protein AVEN_52093-1 [Araneus ventricosus]